MTYFLREVGIVQLKLTDSDDGLDGLGLG
jgi:hypothetical protein